ncbi:MAG: hypothetical protein V3V16_04780 [Melioribacteraceae bacterium]
MGFSTIIDILGSSLVGGMILLIMFRLNDSSVENSFMYTGDLIVQQNLVSIVDVLNEDFSKIGYCNKWENLPDPTIAIISATDTSISFLTDFVVLGSAPFGDGVIDTLHYFTGRTSELNRTPNPRDKILYRVEGAETPNGSNLGITEFNLKYYDNTGNQLTAPVLTSKIATIQIDIKIEDVYGYDTENEDKTDSEKFSNAVWKQLKIAAPNLKNR